ncbi:peptide chain release factor N(5)-glutamine methyltransferase [Virgibacillus sp. 179-BFC.A HS]|uniref:Release factor glutamine methyltransferase n=1 Tax=Tigheibacillus jepli TaxID=3035914 RepID=A0ABU5CFD1_9BACI|nr:peptide chain release factor N(5)-glutamine methyltransferase [Virgibacillus sp. 179-BFC.A HS]MDY0404549.1 peptide chain release factor N(5)-glutamine methyltransferase [Virgibacillus sp. 179-BFC.A HS]
MGFLFLKQHQCEEHVAQILLAHYLGVSRSEFFARMQEEVPRDVVNEFQAAIRRHVQTGIPVQHLMGYEIFYGRKFKVNKDVLIPRPETEELVYHAITAVQKNRKPGEAITIVDVGTGSGIIAITLALELEDVFVYATDLSDAALAVAKENAGQLGADVTFLQGNFLEPFIRKALRADLVISNPPYIAFSEKESMSRTVTDFDPGLALFADHEGLAAYEEIIAQLPDAIANHAHVMFEIGYQQGEAVRALIQKTFPQGITHVLKDINGKDRIVASIIEK